MFKITLKPIMMVAIFTVAACGLGYELIISALASYLMGDSVLQYSTIIGSYMFSMGVGAYIVQKVKDEDLLYYFINIELLVGIIGSLGVYGLFLLYGYEPSIFKISLYFLIFIVGTLVGSEVPLVIRMINIINEENTNAKFAETISNVLSLDYMGALAISLFFPLVLVPLMGVIGSASILGLVNTMIALLMLFYFSMSSENNRNNIIASTFTYKELYYYRVGVVFLMVVLLGVAYFSNRIINFGEGKIFGDIILSKKTDYQKIVMAKEKNGETRLFLNGNLQYSSMDEKRYHESLVHVGFNSMPIKPHYDILILGGGDGMAAREMLKYKDVYGLDITLVDLDKGMTDLATMNPIMSLINKKSFSDPHIKVYNSDAALWIKNNNKNYDFIIVDFPDPSNFSLGKLYSYPFYRLLKSRLNRDGIMVIQSTSPYYAPNAFWCVDKTLKATGLYTLPYHAPIPSFGGDWGFILASNSILPHDNIGDRLNDVSKKIDLEYIDVKMLDGLFYFSKDLLPTIKNIEVNKLNNQKLVSYFIEDWDKVLK